MPNFTAVFALCSISKGLNYEAVTSLAGIRLFDGSKGKINVRKTVLLSLSRQDYVSDRRVVPLVKDVDKLVHFRL